MIIQKKEKIWKKQIILLFYYIHSLLLSPNMLFSWLFYWFLYWPFGRFWRWPMIIFICLRNSTYFWQQTFFNNLIKLIHRYSFTHTTATYPLRIIINHTQQIIRSLLSRNNIARTRSMNQINGININAFISKRVG